MTYWRELRGPSEPLRHDSPGIMSVVPNKAKSILTVGTYRDVEKD